MKVCFINEIVLVTGKSDSVPLPLGIFLVGAWGNSCGNFKYDQRVIKDDIWGSNSEYEAMRRNVTFRVIKASLGNEKGDIKRESQLQ